MNVSVQQRYTTLTARTSAQPTYHSECKHRPTWKKNTMLAKIVITGCKLYMAPYLAAATHHVSRTTAASKHVKEDCLHFLMSCMSPQHVGRRYTNMTSSQHRVSPFRLTDPTKPGHRRFIALWLVDPHARIISTANVPPQQQDWWAESILGKSDESRASALSNLPFEIALILKEKGVDIESNAGEERPKLPIELREMVSAHLNAEGGNLLMSEQEAKMHREKLMEVRGAFHDAADEGWHQHSYSFCEH